MNPSEMISFSKRAEIWLNEWSTVSGIDTTVLMEDIEGLFSPSEEVQLFGIIQEAFTNIRKHSGAKSAVLLVSLKPHGWEMTIKDDGKGFSTDAITLNQYGLAMLKERVDKIGAVLDLSSERSQGTKLTIKGSDNHDAL